MLPPKSPLPSRRARSPLDPGLTGLVIPRMEGRSTGFPGLRQIQVSVALRSWNTASGICREVSPALSSSLIATYATTSSLVDGGRRVSAFAICA